MLSPSGLECFKMPTEEDGLIELLRGLRDNYTVAALEQQIPRPTRFFNKQAGGIVSSILKSTCILYAQYMQTRIVLKMLGIPFQTVVPETWQTAVGIPHKKKERSDNAWKNVLKQKAISLFPENKITLWSADAALLAYYCRQTHTPLRRRTRAIQ